MNKRARFRSKSWYGLLTQGGRTVITGKVKGMDRLESKLASNAAEMAQNLLAVETLRGILAHGKRLNKSIARIKRGKEVG